MPQQYFSAVRFFSFVWSFIVLTFRPGENGFVVFLVKTFYGHVVRMMRNKTRFMQSIKNEQFQNSLIINQCIHFSLGIDVAALLNFNCQVIRATKVHTSSIFFFHFNWMTFESLNFGILKKKKKKVHFGYMLIEMYTTNTSRLSITPLQRSPSLPVRLIFYVIIYKYSFYRFGKSSFQFSEFINETATILRCFALKQRICPKRCI